MDAGPMSTFKHVSILGAGLLGHGIAVAHAVGGCPVKLFDISAVALEAAKAQIAGALDTLVDSKVLTADAAQQARDRVEYVPDLAQALRGANIVVESVTENLDIKRALYEEVADLAPQDAILASNTSYLDIFPAVPDALKHRCFIIHWYTPPYIIDLVDIVPGPQVPQSLSDEVYEFMESLGKKPVRLKRFVSGYIANRIQMAIESEAFRLLDSGVAEVEDIDRSISQGLGLRLALFGQFRKIDFTGLKIVRDSHRLGIYEPPTPPTVSTVLEALVDQGRQGVLSGSGFYDYSKEDAVELFRKRDRDLLALKASLQDLAARR